VKGCGENITLQQLQSSPRMDTEDVSLSLPGTSECTNMSSPKLNGRAMEQRLSILEKKYEDLMKELCTEKDRLKESIETFDTNINIPLNSNAHDKATLTEEFKVLQKCLSELTKNFTDSVTELKAEINSSKLEEFKVLRECLSELTKNFTDSVTELTAEINNLKLEVITLGLEAGQNKVQTKSSKRKISVPNEVAEPSKVLKIEPPDTDDKAYDFLGFGFEVDQNGYVHVYTDGACENNGRVGARAGIGVWFADNHPL